MSSAVAVPVTVLVRRPLKASRVSGTSSRISTLTAAPLMVMVVFYTYLAPLIRFVIEEMHKEARHRVLDYRDDETMYQRVYGRSRLELTILYYEETGNRIRNTVEYPDWQEFTYWLFKTRLKRQDKARVASDTRKGLAQLTRMELAITDRRRGASLDEADFARRFGG